MCRRPGKLYVNTSQIVLDLHIASFYILSFFTAGLTGLFCPCVLFGRNVQSLREDTHWTRPCICHAILVEGGISLGIANVAAFSLIPGINPWISCLICEGLYFSWLACSEYTGQVRQSLQKKYHLKVHKATEGLNFAHVEPHLYIILLIIFFVYNCRIHLVVHVVCIAACTGVPCVKSTGR